VPGYNCSCSQGALSHLGHQGVCFPLIWFISDILELKVNPGDTVTLPCLDPGHTTLQMLQWSRPDQLSHGYVYFYRDGHLLERYQHSSYHGRVEVKDLGMKDGDFSLILRNVSINDTGKYECRIGRGTSGRRKRHDPVLLSTINLKVDDSGLLLESSSIWQTYWFAVTLMSPLVCQCLGLILPRQVSVQLAVPKSNLCLELCSPTFTHFL
uniref:Ig-like domain-containing protein n=1 Tax=Monopterus albus TaxID=43700 RepID=A0A3Q3K1V5_MONAL